MSMIFDRFPSQSDADAFIKAVDSKCGLNAVRYDTIDDSDLADPFPFELSPPIVHVQRADSRVEAKVQSLVREFRGEFAGT